MQLIEKTDIAPGMPFLAYKNNLAEIKEIFKKEISENIKTDKQGIVAKADSLGSLEALLVLLKQSNIPVLKAGIGKINKSDIVCAKANLEIDELDAAIAGFNIEIEEDAKELKGNIKIITSEVIYDLIDKLVDFRKEKAKEIEKRRLMGLAHLCKLNILHQYLFRNTNPAIFGVKIDAGKMVPGTNLIDETGEEIGRIKNIQSEKKSVQEATESMEVAISISGTNFERQLKDKKFLYSDMGESHFKNFKKNKDLLSQNELKALQELAEIKRQKKPEWGV
jgi:translation initiation factor 5B